MLLTQICRVSSNLFTEKCPQKVIFIGSGRLGYILNVRLIFFFKIECLVSIAYLKFKIIINTFFRSYVGSGAGKARVYILHFTLAWIRPPPRWSDISQNPLCSPYSCREPGPTDSTTASTRLSFNCNIWISFSVIFRPSNYRYRISSCFWSRSAFFFPPWYLEPKIYKKFFRNNVIGYKSFKYKVSFAFKVKK